MCVKYTAALLQKSLKKVRSSNCNPLHAQQAIQSLVFFFFQLIHCKLSYINIIFTFVQLARTPLLSSTTKTYLSYPTQLSQLWVLLIIWKLLSLEKEKVVFFEVTLTLFTSLFSILCLYLRLTVEALHMDNPVKTEEI